MEDGATMEYAWRRDESPMVLRVDPESIRTCQTEDNSVTECVGSVSWTRRNCVASPGGGVKEVAGGLG
jgi:hypothetical protein